MNGFHGSSILTPQLASSKNECAIDFFMSILNQIFNRGLIGQKGKTCLSLAISRIKLLQNKREGQLKLMRKEIAQFLQAGQESIARIRVEHVIREQNIWDAYSILELFCEFIIARIPILENQRECPRELQEAVSSIIFAAPRCSDLPDLLQVRNLFSGKYGKEFVAAASDLRPNSSVNRTIIEKLLVSAPSGESKLKVLTEITKEYNVQWDSFNTEAEFSKKPEDLLNGPKVLASSQHCPTKNQPYSNPPRVRCTEGNVAGQIPNLNPSITASKPIKNGSNPFEALEKARVAIAAAERASSAARIAACLVVNVKSSNSVKLEEK